MVLSLSTLLLIFQGVLASSVSATRSCKLNTATFDDLTPLPVAPQLQPNVGAYQGLSYASKVAPQVLAVFSGLTIGSINPASGDQTIGNGVGNIPGLLAGSLTGQAVITTTPSVQDFDLDSVFFGCIVNSVAPQASLASPCTLSATGYGWDDVARKYVQRSAESLAYTPIALQGIGKGAEMLPYKFENMKKMVNVTIGFAELIEGWVSVLMLDNVTNCQYTK